MKKKAVLLGALLAGLGLAPFSLYSQNGTTVNIAVPPANQLDTSGFLYWGKDLRRAEIIAFGTFPFTLFTATFAMDTWRASKNDWDGRYLPWPLKTAGAVEMTNREHEIVMISAASASVLLALADFIIVKIKDRQTRQRALEIPEGTPIIIKRPLSGGDGEDHADDPAETPAPESPAAEGPDIPPAVP
jgi:hypothetical protein